MRFGLWYPFTHAPNGLSMTHPFSNKAKRLPFGKHFMYAIMLVDACARNLRWKILAPEARGTGCSYKATLCGRVQPKERIVKRMQNAAQESVTHTDGAIVWTKES